MQVHIEVGVLRTRKDKKYNCFMVIVGGNLGPYIVLTTCDIRKLKRQDVLKVLSDSLIGHTCLQVSAILEEVVSGKREAFFKGKLIKVA